ncbi:lipopolysaccharide biosynthesis protein [Staphylococcus pseudintermedius]|uniref:lipopolysaccharide biosynthesis protein n=1 Tax=Staphylococcus pseudintermedius TaxID=283734 RepID=UPI003F659A93
MKKITNIMYTFVGNATLAFIKWLILILIVRLTTPNEVGSYTFAVAVSTPIMMFANMRLRLRYVVEDQWNYKSVKLTRELLNAVAFMVVLIIATIIYPQYFTYIILISIIKILDLESEFYYALLHKVQNFRRIGLLQIGKSINVILFFAISLLISKSVVVALVFQLVSQLLWLVLFELKAKKNIVQSTQPINQNKIKALIIIGLPLGVVQLVNAYNILIPRYAIEKFLNVSLVGIFASVSYLLTIIDLFMNAISQNIIIRIKDSFNNKRYGELEKYIFKKVPIYSAFIGLMIIIPVYFFKDAVVFIVYGQSYINYSDILLIISFSIIFNFQSWIFDTMLMAFQVYKFQLISSLVTLIVSLIASVTLINYFGIYGASFAVLIITMTQAMIKFLIILISLKKLKREESR